MYFDCWRCAVCGKNGQYQGGLEIHHIKGRISSSALNSVVVCGKCHSQMGHSQEEEISLMIYTIKFLLRNNYQFHNNDISFYNRYKKQYDTYDKTKGIGNSKGNFRIS